MAGTKTTEEAIDKGQKLLTKTEKARDKTYSEYALFKVRADGIKQALVILMDDELRDELMNELGREFEEKWPMPEVAKDVNKEDYKIITSKLGQLARHNGQ